MSFHKLNSSLLDFIPTDPPRFNTTLTSTTFEEEAEMAPVPQYWTLFLLLFPVLTVFGNILVVISIYKERSLQTVTNYFIFSLAIADIMVAILVMPLAIYVEIAMISDPLAKCRVNANPFSASSVNTSIFLCKFLQFWYTHYESVNNGIWSLGDALCDAFVALDVMCCTASILNLTAISVDRFIAVTQPIQYAKHKNSRRVFLMLALTWVISLAISSPIALGMNYTDQRISTECTFYNADFLIYSSMGSFYIPCIVMVLLYWRIFHAIRTHTHRHSAAYRSQDRNNMTSSSRHLHDVTDSRRSSKRTDTGGGGGGNYAPVEKECRCELLPKPSKYPPCGSEEALDMETAFCATADGFIDDDILDHLKQSDRNCGDDDCLSACPMLNYSESDLEHVGPAEIPEHESGNQSGTLELYAGGINSPKITRVTELSSSTSRFSGPAKRPNTLNTLTSNSALFASRENSSTGGSSLTCPRCNSKQAVCSTATTSIPSFSAHNNPNTGNNDSKYNSNTKVELKTGSANTLNSLSTPSSPSNNSINPSNTLAYPSNAYPGNVMLSPNDALQRQNDCAVTSWMKNKHGRSSLPSQRSSKSGPSDDLDPSRNCSLRSGMNGRPDYGRGASFDSRDTLAWSTASTTGLKFRFKFRGKDRSCMDKATQNAHRREKKATKTLAIVLGVFLLCWVPFFTINILRAVCIRYDLFSALSFCSMDPILFAFFVWLGYMNSFLNPVIYTIFNAEFRRAFKKLLQVFFRK